jgi:hypothetical protein
MRADMSIEEFAACPNTNLAETVHSSWWQSAGNGRKKKTNLVSASIHDIVQALMQQSRYQMFLKGIGIGTGPSYEDLMLRATNRSGDIKKNYHGKGIGAENDSRPKTTNKSAYVQWEFSSSRPTAFTVLGLVRNRPPSSSQIHLPVLATPDPSSFISYSVQYPPPPPPSTRLEGVRAMFSTIVALNEPFNDTDANSSPVIEFDNVSPSTSTHSEGLGDEVLISSMNCGAEFCSPGQDPEHLSNSMELPDISISNGATFPTRGNFEFPRTGYVNSPFPIQAGQVVLETQNGVPLSQWHIA